MTGQNDYFADLLQPGESVMAAIGAAGPDDSGSAGGKVWWQLAWTADRLLVVELAARGRGWEPVSRFAAPRAAVRVARYPRTDASSARLEIDAAGRRVVLLDIDGPQVFPLVEPFLAAWGGPVEGAGIIHAQAVDPLDEEAAHDTRKLLMVVALSLLLVAGCCGCSGVILGLRRLLAAW